PASGMTVTLASLAGAAGGTGAVAGASVVPPRVAATTATIAIAAATPNPAITAPRRRGAGASEASPCEPRSVVSGTAVATVGLAATARPGSPVGSRVDGRSGGIVGTPTLSPVIAAPSRTSSV